MIATLLATMFCATALLAIGAMWLSWKSFGFQFHELRRELRAIHDPVTVRYTRRDIATRATATVYNLDFKAKADCLPFHPELRHALPVAA
ncbi:MAG: hypothetical protein ABIR02_00710 [Novosphingobium sp.]